MSSVTGLLTRLTPAISTSTTSPGTRVPTPSGVPVRTRSPGSNVMIAETYAKIARRHVVRGDDPRHRLPRLGSARLAQARSDDHADLPFILHSLGHRWQPD